MQLLEYMEGGTLGSKMSSLKAMGKRIAVSDFWRWAEEIALGLNFLHKCNPQIIHRDLKPSNLLFDRYGSLKVTPANSPLPVSPHHFLSVSWF